MSARQQFLDLWLILIKKHFKTFSFLFVCLPIFFFPYVTAPTVKCVFHFCKDTFIDIKIKDEDTSVNFFLHKGLE